MGHLVDELNEYASDILLEDLDGHDLCIAAASEIEAQGKRIAELEAALHATFYEGFEAGDVDDDADHSWDRSRARTLLTQEE